MKNEKYYNEEIKQRYLDNIDTNKETRDIIGYTFKSAGKTEAEFKKDIYEMNIDEIAEVIKGLAASTITSAYNYTFKIGHYIDWAAQNGYRASSINPLSGVEDRRKWVEPFVSTYKQSRFTKEEIMSMCQDLVNYQDRVILLSLFEGIQGKGFSELLSLKTQNIKEVDGKNFVTLYDKTGSDRTIEISEKLADWMYKADNELKYYNKNGESDSVKSSESILVESDYVLKKSARGSHDGELTFSLINRRFKMFKEIFDAEFLTPREIIESGILHMVHEFHATKGFIEEDDWKEIAEHYNTSFIDYNGKKTRDIYKVKRKANDSFEKKYGYKITIKE